MGSNNWPPETEEKYADIFRRMIEHENELQNNRFSWFITLQGFIIAG